MCARKLMVTFAVVALAVASTGAWAASGEVNLWYGQKNADFKSQTGDFQREVTQDPFGITYSSTGTDTFSDLEDMGQIGLMTSWGLDWPVAIAADLFYANSDVQMKYTSGEYYGYLGIPGRGGEFVAVNVDEFYKIDYTTYELDLGIRKYWGGKVQLLLGAGVAIASAKADVNFFDDVDIRPVGTRGEPPFIEPGGLFVDESESGSDFGLWADIGFVWRAGNFFNLGVDVRYSSVNVDLSFDPDPDEAPVRFPAGGVQYGLFIGGRW